MKLPEAIKRGERMWHRAYDTDEWDDKHALRILIEAGKRCQLARKETSFIGPGPLPGETED